jgi:DNA-binding response OmpR family regulator
MAGERILVIDDSPTITKVVQLVLTKAGFAVQTAADGEAGLAAVRAERPDVILLDFVMPRMNGYQFCRELNADAKLRDIPVVLMSAKGDQVGERFVKVMGIVDYITKPFSPEAITAVVQHTVGKYAAAKAPADASSPSLVTAEDLAATDDADRSRSRSTALAQLRTSIAAALARSSVVAAETADTAVDQPAPPFGGAAARGQAPVVDTPTLSPAASTQGAIAATNAEAVAVVTDEVERRGVGTLPAPPVGRGSSPVGSLDAALDDATLIRLLGSIDLGLFGDAAPGLRGDLRVVPLAEVLRLFDAQDQSGTLTVEHSGARVDIYFRRGRIEQAIATGVSDELLLGRFLVDAELVPRAELDGSLVASAGDPPLLGQRLVQLGRITDADLKACLTRQTSQLIYESLRWRHGRFRFAAGAALPTSVLDAALGLDVETVLMEGYRRVDEWHLIERAIDNFDIVFLRNDDSVTQMGRGRLTRDELAVLELVNGKNTVQEIIRKSQLRSFEVSKMLYRLLSIKLIRRRVLPVAV